MLTLLFAGWVLCPIIVIGIFSSPLSPLSGGMATSLEIVRWMTIVLCAVGTVVLGWLFMRLCVVPSRVNEHDGEVCPTCIEPMTRVANDDAPDALLRCDSCAAEFNRLGLRRYWNGFPFPAWSVRQWYFERARPRSRLHAIRLRLWRFLHDHIAMSTAVYVGLCAVPGMSFMVFGLPMAWTLDPMYLFFRLFPPLAFLGSVICFALSVKYVRELQVLCRKCRYKKHDDFNVSALCPECGHRWHAIGGMRYQAYRFRPARLIIAGLAMVFGLGLSQFNVTQNLSQRYASTATLIDIVVNASEPAWAEWSELQVRELTDAQRLLLIDTVLDWQAEEGNWRHYAAFSWMTAQYNDGKFSDEQLERHLGKYLIFTTSGPSTLRVGETVNIALRGEFRSSGVVGALEVYIGGFRIKGSDDWIDRATESIPASSLTRKAPVRSPDRSQIDYLEPQITVTGAAPGEMIVIAEYWIVARPQVGRLAAAPIIWNDDDTPVLPDDALWVRHERVKHYMHVEE